jgi:hypothetical protein
MSVHNFKSQKRSTLKAEDVSHLPLLDYKDIEDIDSDKYEWEQVGTDKFGRNMYCPKTKTLRTQTIGEFYGTGTVD